MLYADVCVNTPLGNRVGVSLGADIGDDPTSRTFTYAVPARLEHRLEPGHLVWVLFRGRRLQAVVLEIHDRTPEFDTLAIQAVVWSQPPLTRAQLALADWIRGYYLAPLIEALRLMLPVGISQRGRTVLVRTPEPVPPGTLSARQEQFLERIAEDEGTWGEVTEGMRDVTQRVDLEPLIEAGLVTREVAFLTPPPHPKFNRRVRLIADAELIARTLPTLGRVSKPGEALAWLAAQDDPLPSMTDLCNAVGCTQAHVRWLVDRGHVRIIPRKVSIRRTTQDGNPSGLAGSSAAYAKQSSALSALLVTPVDEGEFRAAHGVDAATLRSLIEKGLAERIEEPAQVMLTAEREAVPEIIIKLRGAEKHRALLEALGRYDGPAWIGWVYAETDADLTLLRELEAAGLINLSEEMVWRDPLAGYEFTPDEPPPLSPDQERVWADVSPRLEDDAGGAAMLLYGVTGSGKTEIYLRAIACALARGRQTLVLVPEIALTPQTIRRFAARFPGRVTTWHSELSDGERFDVWRRVRTRHAGAQVVIGSRSALFLPFPDLGLVVVDEEHESSYKQERTPRYHARTVAVEMGRISRIPVLLGSATPALETYYAARQGELELLRLPRRITAWHNPSAAAAGSPGSPSQVILHAPASLDAELPGVQIVDMRQELRVGNRSMLSRALDRGLRQVLAANQQAILYLNRRGAATFIMCRDCGHVENCPRCAVPLAYHSASDLLLCHHCSRHYPAPQICPTCGSRRIRYFGSGTQDLEEVMRQSYPGARVLRWDRDATSSKGAHEAILAQFVAHEADILVGTQMIAKGLDLPLVTLVGVIAADIGLFLPDFRAQERTFQLLTQVAGRAGRSNLGGEVIIQTYHPDHYAIVAASHHDYEGFYRQEMAFRREQDYPPLCRLAKLVYYHTQAEKAQAEATRVAGLLKAEIGRRGVAGTSLLGPIPCYFGQQRSFYRWQLIVRGPDPARLLRGFALPIGWRLDVDPVDTL